MKISLEALMVPKSHLNIERVIFPSTLSELEHSSFPVFWHFPTSIAKIEVAEVAFADSMQPYFALQNSATPSTRCGKNQRSNLIQNDTMC